MEDHNLLFSVGFFGPVILRKWYKLSEVYLRFGQRLADNYFCDKAPMFDKVLNTPLTH